MRCDFCMASEVEDAFSVGLWCMTRLENVCTMTSFEKLDKLDVRLMKNDRTWMMDVLIGKKFGQKILRAVMKYRTSEQNQKRVLQ